MEVMMSVPFLGLKNTVMLNNADMDVLNNECKFTQKRIPQVKNTCHD
jgi:hypothetical protein